MALEQQSNRFVTESVKKYIDKPVGYFLFLSCYNMFTPQEVLELSQKVSSHYKNSNALKYIKEDAERSNMTSNGQSFIDITIPSMDGGELKLSDIIRDNKLTLVDCWASWCGPCRAETPILAEVYNQYKDKGFQVLGVATWDQPKDTKKAIEDLKITWPQILNAQNTPSELYGFNGIPHIILFGPDGTIVARDLRGDALKAKVKEMMQ